MKIAVFDLDGTLTDSLADIAEAANYAMRKLGYPEHELEKFNYMVGDGVRTLIERVLPDENQDRLEEALAIYNEYYNNNYTVKTYVYDGINEMLRTLKNNGVKLAVASNKTHCFTENVIRHYFGDDLFSIVLGKSEGRPVKPNPAILEAVIEKIGAERKNVFMIGDTSIDINTGKNAGVNTIGCLWGFRTFEELKEAGADHIVKKPHEISEIILK